LGVPGVAGFIVVSGLGGAARAGGVLDQSYTAAHNQGAFSGGYVNREFSKGQVFKVGITGLLSEVDLQINRLDDEPLLPLVVEIHPLAPTNPTVLGSFSLDPTNVPLYPGNDSELSFFAVDVTGAGLKVSAGTVLALVVKSETNNGVYLWQSTPFQTAGYPNGNAWYGVNGVWTQASANDDFGFKTYVTPVPEPAMGGLFAVGGVGLLIRRRRVAQ
jgi:hypothetical protein